MTISRLAPLLAVPLMVVGLSSPAYAESDLAVKWTDNLVDGVEREYVTAGSQITYTLTIENVGDEIATGVELVTEIPESVTQVTWTALYAGGASGPVVGAGGPDTILALPAGSTGVFTLIATVSTDAVGEVVVTAAVTGGNQTVTATDTNRLLPSLIAVSQSGGTAPTSRQMEPDSARPAVELQNPFTGETLGSFLAYEPGFRGGVQVSLGDLDGDGSPEVMAAPGAGRSGEIRVFTVKSTSAGALSITRDSARSLQPFGKHYRGGLVVASGDFDGDGLADIAVARSNGSGRVRVYVSRPTSAEKFLRYRTFKPQVGNNPGPITLAAGDFGSFGNGIADAGVADGRFELVVGGGIGVEARIQIRDVSRRNAPMLNQIDLPRATRVGFHVSVARVTKDGIPDLIVSYRHGKRLRVAIHDGLVGKPANARVTSFMVGRAYPAAPAFAAGVDVDGDGRADSIHVSWSRPDGERSASRPRARRTTYAIVDQPDGSVAVSAGTAFSAAIYGPLAVAPNSAPGLVTTSTGLQYRDLLVGAGATPSGTSSVVEVTYSGWLLSGTQVDAGDGVSFTLGNVIAGWQEALSTMRVGGRRQLIIPANLAYGASGTGSIPPNSTLVFDIQLLSAD